MNQKKPLLHGTRRSEPPPVAFIQDELKRLFAAIKTSKRDRAIFYTAYLHGLRASEIGLLQIADLDLKRGRISIQRLKGSSAGVYPLKPTAWLMRARRMKKNWYSGPVSILACRVRDLPI